MYARAVDDAAARLQALREQERGELGLGVIALVLAVAATQVRPSLAAPLFVGGLGIGVLGLRALWRRWDLLERLAGERDAHVIPEVRAYATREATMERRKTYAALVRKELLRPERAVDPRVAAVADELEALAAELEDGDLALDPAAAVSCMRLLSDVAQSPLLNPARPPEELRSRICQIRYGFSPVVGTQAASTAQTPAASLG
jgi:hypothetical protein